MTEDEEGRERDIGVKERVFSVLVAVILLVAKK